MENGEDGIIRHTRYIVKLSNGMYFAGLPNSIVGNNPVTTLHSVSFKEAASQFDEVEVAKGIKNTFGGGSIYKIFLEDNRVVDSVLYY